MSNKRTTNFCKKLNFSNEKDKNEKMHLFFLYAAFWKLYDDELLKKNINNIFRKNIYPALELGRAQFFRAWAEPEPSRARAEPEPSPSRALAEFIDSDPGLIEPCLRAFKSYRAEQVYLVNVLGRAWSSF